MHSSSSFSNAYNLTIPDQSTTIIYSPYRDGDPTHGWQALYSNSNESAYDVGSTENKAEGTSHHTTTNSGSSFQIDFTGTAIALYGQGSKDGYSTTIDGKEAAGDPSGDVLASYQSLDLKHHTLLLNVTNTEELQFTSATITIGVGLPGASISTNTVYAVDTSSGGPALNNYFSTNGAGFSTDHDWPTHPRLDTKSVGGTVSFRPSNASAILVYGSSNADHSTYSVQVTPAVGSTSSDARNFNASSRWFNYDNLIYWESGMDREESYEFKFQNLVNEQFFDIYRVEVLTAEGGEDSNDGNGSTGGISTGAVVGIAVGAAVLILAAALAAFFWRRKRNTRRRPDSYQIDPVMNSNIHGSYSPLLSGHVEPFVMPIVGFPYSDNTQTSGTAYNGGASGRSSKYDSSVNLSSAPTTPGVFHPGFQPTASGSSSHSQSASNDYGRGYRDSKHSGGPPGDSAVTSLRQEEDAGPVPAPVRAQDREEVLPPNYNPAWSSVPGPSNT